MDAYLMPIEDVWNAWIENECVVATRVKWTMTRLVLSALAEGEDELAEDILAVTENWIGM